MLKYRFNISTASGDTANIPLYLNDSFATNMLQNDSIVNEYAESRKDMSISKIIDYEKAVFDPVVDMSGIKSVPVRYIRFNPRFRDRWDGDKIDEMWATNDSKEWNLKTGENNCADMLASLGFNHGDIYYMKSKVSKSFLRLSFYDSNNRMNNRLIYYATLFLDSGAIYSRFLRKVAKDNNGQLSIEGIDMEDNSLIKNYEKDDDTRVDCRLECYDRNNMSGCSEGFYLYLYPNYTNDKDGRKIYMRADFCNAKYGITVPLMFRKNGKAIPKGFIENGSVKFDELDKFLYLPVNVRYNSDSRRYEWAIDVNDCHSFNPDIGELVFELYEPRVNSKFDIGKP